MSKYVAVRKDICAGELLKTAEFTYKLYDANSKEINKEDLQKQGIFDLQVSCGLICRPMLFNVTEDRLANDLIYTTPTNYFIKGINPKAEIKSEFIIANYVELDELLKYLKYPEDLTQKDLYKIYKTLIISNKWLKQNIQLFGWQKTKMGYISGGIETIPMEIYDKLSWINCSTNGNPHKDEPFSRLIKRIK